jgi:carboxymethylenebutenolidase
MVWTEALRTSEGDRIAGYATGDGGRAILVIHEIFGLNQHIRGIADRFAASGFRVFAIDLFDGWTTADVGEGISRSSALDYPSVVERIRRATDAVRIAAGVTSVGIVGFCLGGSIAMVAASQIPALAACVDFYGIPSPDKGDLGRIQGRVLGHFASGDPYIPLERVDALEAQLRKGGVRAEIHRYEYEGHGFVREDPEGAATKLAWERTLAFLRDSLP